MLYNPAQNAFLPGAVERRHLNMVEHPSDFGSGQPPKFRQLNSRQLSHERRLLELQLIQLRSEATAAKLEARAAEVEIMLRRMVMTEAGVETALDCPSIDRPPITRQPTSTQDLSVDLPSVHQSPSLPAITNTSNPKKNPFESLAVIKDRDQPSSSRTATPSHRPASERLKPATSKKRVEKHNNAPSKSKRNCESTPKIGQNKVDHTKPSPVGLDKSATETTPPTRSRSRPKAVLFSAAIHVGLLFLLAAISLHVPRPQDQVSLTAISAESVPEPLATVTVESSEPQVEPTSAKETEAEVSFDQLAEVTNVKVESANLELTPMDSLLSSGVGSANSGARSLASSSSAEKITFCGVEGGGNHFVYLVDCSKSMGTAFESARAELLHSIEALSPHQRFYVIFFDASPEYMRVSRPDVDDPQSVLATAENKQALRRWAASIKMDSGEAPYRPLEFALQLRPDVIFLLSDGEFPAGIERLLQEENRVDNLFGDQDVKSIVHTIGYYSSQGEVRMRAIASQNQGQYRYVPKPVASR